MIVFVEIRGEEEQAMKAMRLKTVTVAALLVMVAAACGNGAADELVLVAGFVPGSIRTIGFAFEGEEITSPGPTIEVRKGETVTITFENAHYYEDGRAFSESHNLTVVEDKDLHPVSQMEPLWGAQVGGFQGLGVAPNLKAGERGSVTFTAETAGEFYYVCAVPGHIGGGMWGRFIVVDK